ncbi:GA module-containing protein [Enterococcus sp. DIV0242_7C1]|uniref:Extracellular matrix-binding protein ebh GA module domain-containing protein n=1 Tax=Candidatus Enterococcus dunnyi TaxID=1834192 RepID=A0A200J8T5_9ENTE|nr:MULTISPECIES: KxYKxGKxW signal peptide domain-containing protein [unclassified Enterococcus]MBO0470541.1 GA module-containing protein [Enterococcus sp. DIV0242_7C1]OUZ32985.1 hypothetical protein A5889_001694 [Enterococcus sp. 9D6_DIV0238]
MKSNKNFRKDDLSPESNTKKIYKMYKRKKQWVVAPVVLGLLLNALSPVAVLAVSDAEQTDAIAAQARAVDNELLELIEQATTNINALVSLTPEAKATYVADVQKSDTKEKVEEELLKAYREDIAEAVKVVDALYVSKIDGLTSLSTVQKEAAKNAISTALALDSLKSTFNAIADSTTYSTFKEAFDKQLAKNKEAADILVKENVELNAALADLPKYKAEQKNVISSLSQLQEIEKQNFYTEIDKAEDKGAIDGIVTGAKAENEARLATAVTTKVTELKVETAKLALLNPSKQTELDAKIDAAAAESGDAALAKLNALTSEIEKAIADATANDQSAKLNAAKSELKAEIANEKKTNQQITDADVSAFNSRIDSAKTLEAVAVVKADWLSFVAAASIKGKELAEAKSAATSLIGGLMTIDATLKANYLKDVELAQTSEEVAAIVTSAQAEERKAVEKNAAELKAIKDQAIKEINALTNLTKVEKKAKTDAVEATDDKAEIAELVKTAKEADAAKALTAEKEAAKVKVNTLGYLSDAAKASAKTAIDAATDSAAITALLNKAIYDDYKAGVANAEVELEEAKTIAKEAINKLENLTVAQRDAALKDIAKATNKDAVTNVLDLAKTMDQENADANEEAKILEKTKSDAKAEIDALTYLTQEMKNGYKAEVTNAKDAAAVAEVLNRANTENTNLETEKTEFENAKKELVDQINNSAELTAEDKKSLISEAIDCKTKAEVADLTIKVKQLIADRAVENANEASAKATIKAQIDLLDELSAAQKLAYKNRVDALEKKADMVAVYNEAKAENNRVADKATVNNITKLIASGSFVEAQKEINKLRTDSIRKEYQAKLDESIALATAKAEANKQIDALENLSAEEKIAAKEKVSKLTTKSAVEKAVAELVKADNLAHDKDLIDIVTLQIKAKEFEAAAKTIERIRDAETKAKLQKQLEDAQKVAPTIKGTGHVSKIGWQKTVDMNEIIGTTGRKLALEAVKINLADVDMPEGAKKLEGGIEYRAHVRNIGWQKYVSNGAIAGTTGKSLQMEAIQIKLTGELAEKYNVEYRAHVKDIGWQKYVSNGTIAGTTGKSLRMEAVQIRLVEKK